MTQKEIINLFSMPSFMAKSINCIFPEEAFWLDVVKSNIEQLGGDVVVKTKLGEGEKALQVRLPDTCRQGIDG